VLFLKILSRRGGREKRKQREEETERRGNREKRARSSTLNASDQTPNEPNYLPALVIKTV